uniref:Uncharacterized protein n=1 Tax=Cajanus cajan TaxID=3821 RepID=A0A151RJT4_CAJCA|nr:hypothetical protein KK1_035747 [Cajanus cajan]
MKKFADQSRRELNFEVGDLVYVRLRPRRQSSVSGTHSAKLMKHFFGPFKVTQKIGTVAYELELPSSARIHNVFHVSLLKPHKGPVTSAPRSLPPVIEDNHPILEPGAILNWKMDTSSNPPQVHVLIHWQGLPLEEATWEPWNQLQQQFHLEDEVFLEPGGDVKDSRSFPLVDTHSPTKAHTELPHAPTVMAAPERSSKRSRQQPQHLKDYVVTCPSSRRKGNSVRRDY